LIMSTTASETVTELPDAVLEPAVLDCLGRTGELARVVAEQMRETAPERAGSDVKFAHLRGLLTKYVHRGTPLAER
jgi:hypothetical protein